MHSVQPQIGVQVQTVSFVPNDPTHRRIVAILNNNTAIVLNGKGKAIDKIVSEADSNFITGTVSHQGKLLYTLSEDSFMRCFEISTGKLVGQLKVCEEEVIGLSSHPFSNIVAINTEKNRIYLYNKTEDMPPNNE